MDWKEKLSELRSKLPQVESTPDEQQETVAQESLQLFPLRIELDKRNGKPATLITDFEGTDDELKELAKLLRTKCASGGSQRNGEILIQGDFRVKVAEILQEMGYKVKRINFK
ncbi:MAG: translation initiation factor [Bacteroidales bacterium]|nr:translation initiation factor [Bacteroidales bacterium]